VKDRKSWAVAASLGTTLVVAAAIGFAAGYYLDGWLHTSPYMTLAGFFIGVIAGFWSLIKEIRRHNKNG